MLFKFFNYCMKFLKKQSSKMNDEEPKLVQESLGEFLKGVGKMVSSAAHSKENRKNDSEVGQAFTRLNIAFSISLLLKE